MSDTLVRWRASPKKVRVTLKPHNGGYLCTITSKMKPMGVSVWRRMAKYAVLRGIIMADRAGLPMDLGCGWAYEHPFLRKAKK